MRHHIVYRTALLCLALFIAAPLGAQGAGIVIDGFVDPAEGWTLMRRDCKDLNILSTDATPMWVEIYTACDDKFAYIGFISTPVVNPLTPVPYDFPMGVDFYFTDGLALAPIDPDCYTGGNDPPPPWGEDRPLEEGLVATGIMLTGELWKWAPGGLEGEKICAPGAWLTGSGTQQFCDSPTDGCDPLDPDNDACDSAAQALREGGHMHFETRWPIGVAIIQSTDGTLLPLENALWTYWLEAGAPGYGISRLNNGHVACDRRADRSLDFCPDGIEGNDFGSYDKDSGLLEYLPEAWIEPVCPVPPEIAGAFIDIKPGDCPNSLNRKSKGVLPVALLGHAEFDIYEVDQTSLRLEGQAPVHRMNHIEDVAGPHIQPADEDPDPCACGVVPPDGYDDIMMHFSIPDLVAASIKIREALRKGEEVELVLTGRFENGEMFSATDCVKLVGGGKKDWPEPGGGPLPGGI